MEQAPLGSTALFLLCMAELTGKSQRGDKKTTVEPFIREKTTDAKSKEFV